MVQNTYKLLGGFMVPQRLCVSCGMPVGDSKAAVSASAGSGNQSLSLKFPVCGNCDAARQRVDKMEGRKGALGCAIGLPIGIIGYFAYHFLSGRDSISWMGMLLCWFLAYAVIILLFGKRLTREKLDPQDREAATRLKSAVKMSNFKEAHAWTDGSVTIRFENAMYAGDFQTANIAKTMPAGK
jgi:hypothetical protein